MSLTLPQKQALKVIGLLACGNLLALYARTLTLHPYKWWTTKSVGCREGRDKLPTRANDVATFLWELQQEALNKGSSLRFDWTNLPPITPLGQAIDRSQSQCLNESAVKEHGPQHIVHFELLIYGMGSDMHTWMDPLCHAVENNKVLITGGKKWQWNDEELCTIEFQRKMALKADDWPAPGIPMFWDVPDHSSLWCYFGWHESALRCPPGTLAWNASVVDYGMDWERYTCHKITEKYGRRGMHAAVAEWLFQNVSQLVIKEAERQIREEAFPLPFNGTATLSNNDDTCTDTFQRWIGMPDADSLITVHIRWGDKASEMELVSLDEVINATISLLTPDELSGRKVVHIYLATEDPAALLAFKEAATQRGWQVHASGPTNPVAGAFKMIASAKLSKGRAGLESLAALLIALEANRYVLSRGSNWSRLIDELRKAVVDSRCGDCTKMIDLRDFEWR